MKNIAMGGRIVSLLLSTMQESLIRVGSVSAFVEYLEEI